MPRLLPFRLSGPAKMLLSVICFTVFFVLLFGVFMLRTYSPPDKSLGPDGAVARVTQDRGVLTAQTIQSIISGRTNASSSSLPSSSVPSSSLSSSPSTSVAFVNLVASPSGTPHSNSTAIQPLRSWPEGSFCDEFLSNRFPSHVSVCGNDRLVCSGTQYDSKTSSCAVQRLAIDMEEFSKVMLSKRDSVESSSSIWLVQDDEHQPHPCSHRNFQPLDKYMSGRDFMKYLAKGVATALPRGQCTKWVNGTTFLFIAFDVHIYFKFLSWFSLFNGIANNEELTHQPPTLIIRMPETKFDFMFPEFERALFPEATVVALNDLATAKLGTLCFEKAIFTPWAFATNAFRCKMADAIVRLRRKCYDCKGRDLNGTRFHLFRQKALTACSLHDGPPYTGKTPRKIVVQLRKPYVRFQGDQPTKISRILENSQSLITALREEFPMTNITTMFSEDMSICDQISLVHGADVLMGVHGAGLVHLWWLQEHALLFELVPRSQLSNPTFKMLSTLAGRRYVAFNIKGSDKKVTVDERGAVKRLKAEY